MGGLCSRSYNELSNVNGNVNVIIKSNLEQSGLNPPQLRERMEKQLQEPSKKLEEEAVVYHEMNTAQYPDDDFYDGIPRYNRAMQHKSRSVRSTQAAVAKVSEVSSRLGRAGTLGLGKAVEVLDTLGSSMTNLNPSSGFVYGAVTKGNELSILAFEVANTIVKGSNLMQSLSKRSIRQLKEVVLLSEGVQNLVSKDMDALLRIVAADKREELKIFSGEVVRFGNRCKDPQWHNLDRYFDKISREFTPQNRLKEEAELMIEQLLSLVQYTAELYHELQVLDRFEQDYQRKRQEEDNSVATQKGDSLTILKAELKSQRKQVKIFKKKALWSRSLEEVMEKLVDIVPFILLEIHNTFGSADCHLPAEGSVSNCQRLGPAGLSLHYANIVMQIDTLVARSGSMPPNTRDALYQSLPPSIKSALHSKLQSFHVKEELTVTEIKAEMEKTLQWLVPIATNTAKAHHGFGWVGEWANTGSEANRKPAAGPTDVIRIETLHHADKEKTEAYILEQVLWLHYLVNQSKTTAKGGGMRSSMKTPISVTLQKTNQHPKHESSSATSLTIEDQLILQDVSKKRWIPGISKSQDFDSEKTRLQKHDRLSKSSSHSPTRISKKSVTIEKLPSGVPSIGFGMEKEKALDVIDRVNVIK